MNFEISESSASRASRICERLSETCLRSEPACRTPSFRDAIASLICETPVVCEFIPSVRLSSCGAIDCIFVMTVSIPPIMRSMSDKTQFIVITHRRGTMEEADVLYGVTMQEQGVSRMLTINLNDVEKELNIR